MARHLLTLASLAMLAACSDSTGPAVEQNNPGNGTGTLHVVAEIEAQDVPGGFVTEFRVDVDDAAGNAVSGATVTIQNSQLGTTTLLEDGAGTGSYRATQNLFPAGNFRLDVVRGPDRVENAVVGGLAVHTITSPAANDTVVANQPLVVTWDRPSQALAAEIETHDFDANAIPDTGSYTIPGTGNPARTDQRIRLWRYNQVQLAGGLAGSIFELEVRNTIETVMVQ